MFRGSSRNGLTISFSLSEDEGDEPYWLVELDEDIYTGQQSCMVYVFTFDHLDPQGNRHYLDLEWRMTVPCDTILCKVRAMT